LLMLQSGQGSTNESGFEYDQLHRTLISSMASLTRSRPSSVKFSNPAAA
jgi:hypothetical protein